MDQALALDCASMDRIALVFVPLFHLVILVFVSRAKTKTKTRTIRKHRRMYRPGPRSRVDYRTQVLMLSGAHIVLIHPSSTAAWIGVSSVETGTSLKKNIELNHHRIPYEYHVIQKNPHRLKSD